MCVESSVSVFVLVVVFFYWGHNRDSHSHTANMRVLCLVLTNNFGTVNLKEKNARDLKYLRSHETTQEDFKTKTLLVVFNIECDVCLYKSNLLSL